MQVSRRSGLWLTLIVAFCSIIYELSFAQALTIGFGSTVERYSATIGLFLFSLGLGSLLFSKMKNVSLVNSFILIELAISFCGIVSFLFLLFLSQAHSLAFVNESGQLFALIVSHIPIVLIGVLSGIEIPLLTNLIGEKTFATVLGIDYFGSLLGSILYGFLFYPYFGLFISIVLVATLNLFVVFFFLWQMRHDLTKKLRFVYTLSSIILMGLLLGLLLLEGNVRKLYAQGILKKGFFLYYNAPTPNLELQSHLKTRYANIVKYKFQWHGKEIICLSLDYHTQACDSWTEEYHKGLIDVPMSFFKPEETLSILIVGGGDYIALQNLLRYGERIEKIDLVDIDEQFLEYAKREPFLSQYHKHAYLDEKFELIITDGYNFLRNTKRRYDLIVMDLPGLLGDKTAHLYSVEFFKSAKRALKKEALLITWFYPNWMAYEQSQILLASVKRAGFKYHTNHFSYIEYDIKGKLRLGQVEKYFIFSRTGNRSYAPSPFLSKALNELYTKQLGWREVISFAKPHSILFPNYGIVVKAHYRGTEVYLKKYQ